SEASTAGGEISVVTAGIPAKNSQQHLSVNLNCVPVLTKVSNAWLPPGYQFTISGENIGSSPGKVRVLIGPVPCPIISVSPNAIVAQTPAEFNGYTWGYYQPVRVWINGVPARNTLTISVAD